MEPFGRLGLDAGDDVAAIEPKDGGLNSSRNPMGQCPGFSAVLGLDKAEHDISILCHPLDPGGVDLPLDFLSEDLDVD